MALTDEQHEFRRTVRDLLASHVTPAVITDVEQGLRPATTESRWKLLTDMGLPGLFLPENIGGSSASGTDVAIVAEELGRALCPDPVMAIWDATAALMACGADDQLLAAVASGTARPVLAIADANGRWPESGSPVTVEETKVFGTAAFVECADTATHFVIATHTQSGAELFLVTAEPETVRVAAMDAMVSRWWWSVDFEGSHCTRLDATWRDVLDAQWSAWVRLAAWSGGAAHRLLEDTVAYAKERVQFGVPIGSFQAVQHNLASAAIAAAEVRNLAFAAASVLDTDSPDRALLASAAVVRAGDGFVDVVRRCHQTWGGIGFCTESPVHLFSRRAKLVQQAKGGRPQHLETFLQELLKAGTIRRQAASVEPAPTDTELDRFRVNVRKFAEQHSDPVIARQGAFPQGDTPEKRAFLGVLAQRGWLGLAWPREYGGAGLDPRFQLVLQQELEYYGLPTSSIEVAMVGPTLLRHGSDELRAEFLSRITRGELNVALGYSEPEAGSDLASLSLRAERVEDSYILNGQKMYTSAAHFADVIWLACRTGSPESGHRGISILIVDIDTPGISISELSTLGTHRTNVVFFDDVRVPDTRRVGAENEGWRYIVEALDLERLTGFPTGGFLRDADRLIEWCSADMIGENPNVRKLVAEIGVRSIGAISHFDRALDTLADEHVPTGDATMLKVAVTEARQEHADALLSLVGPPALLRGEAAPLEGHFEELWRNEIISTIAGGANELQRNIIAQRILGLPR